MRHPRPQKKHAFHRTPIVSKSARKIPMATPVKGERRPLKISFSGITIFVSTFLTLLKARFLVFLSVLILVVFIIIFFFTSLLDIKNVAYRFKDEAEDCVSESAIKEHYFKKPAKVWAHYSYDGSSLKKKFPCLDDVSFNWNPFNFNTLSITVESAKPVAEITIVRIDAANLGGSSDQYFISQALGEETGYLTRDGNFITLVAKPFVPKFKYRILKNQKVKDIHISVHELEKLLQIQKYFETEFDTIAIPDVASDGSVRLATPLLEEIYITLHDDLAVQLGSLQAILETSTIDKKKIHLIDLRFGNPVIIFR